MIEVEKTKEEAKVSRITFVFSITFAVWLLFTWPFAPVEWSMVIAGTIVALLAGFLLEELATRHPGKVLNPVRYFWEFVMWLF